MNSRKSFYRFFTVSRKQSINLISEGGGMFSKRILTATVMMLLTVSLMFMGCTTNPKQDEQSTTSTASSDTAVTEGQTGLSSLSGTVVLNETPTTTGRMPNAVASKDVFEVSAFNLDTSTLYETSTNSDGEFMLVGLPEGQYQIVASNETYAKSASKTVLLNRGTMATVNITLEAVGKIVGNTTAQYVGVPGTNIFAEVRKSDGGFVLTGVPLGDVVLKFSRYGDDGREEAAYRMMTIVAGENTFTADINFKETILSYISFGQAGTLEMVMDGVKLVFTKPVHKSDILANLMVLDPSLNELAINALRVDRYECESWARNEYYNNTENYTGFTNADEFAESYCDNPDSFHSWKAELQIPESGTLPAGEYTASLTSFDSLLSGKVAGGSFTEELEMKTVTFMTTMSGAVTNNMISYVFPSSISDASADLSSVVVRDSTGDAVSPLNINLDSFGYGFAISGEFKFGVEYTVTLPTSIADSNGTGFFRFTDDYGMELENEAASNTFVFNGPSFGGVTPVDGSRNVGINDSIKFEILNGDLVDVGSLVVDVSMDGSTTSYPANVLAMTSYDDEVEFVELPGNILEYSKTYDVTIRGTDSYSTQMAPKSIRFSTITPAIVGTSPGSSFDIFNDLFDDRESFIGFYRARFNVPMDASSSAANDPNFMVSNTNVSSCQWNSDNTEYRCDPVAVKPDTEYAGVFSGFVAEDGTTNVEDASVTIVTPAAQMMGTSPENGEIGVTIEGDGMVHAGYIFFGDLTELQKSDLAANLKVEDFDGNRITPTPTINIIDPTDTQNGGNWAIDFGDVALVTFNADPGTIYKIGFLDTGTVPANLQGLMTSDVLTFRTEGTSTSVPAIATGTLFQIFDEFSSMSLDTGKWDWHQIGSFSGGSIVYDSEKGSDVLALHADNDGSSTVVDGLTRGQAEIKFRQPEMEAFSADVKISNYTGNPSSSEARIRVHGKIYSTQTRVDGDDTGEVWCMLQMAINGGLYGMCIKSLDADFIQYEDMGIGINLGQVNANDWHNLAIGFDGENVYFSVDGESPVVAPIDTNAYPVVESGWEGPGVMLRVQSTSVVNADGAVENVQTGPVADVFGLSASLTDFNALQTSGMVVDFNSDPNESDTREEVWKAVVVLGSSLTHNSYTYDESSDIFSLTPDSVFRGEDYYLDGGSWVPWDPTGVTYDDANFSATYSSPGNLKIQLFDVIDLSGQTEEISIDGNTIQLTSLPTGAKKYKIIFRGSPTSYHYELHDEHFVWQWDGTVNDTGPYATLDGFLAENGSQNIIEEHYNPVTGDYDSCYKILVDYTGGGTSGGLIEYDFCTDQTTDTNAGTWQRTTVDGVDILIADISADNYATSTYKNTASILAVKDSTVWLGTLSRPGAFGGGMGMGYNDLVATAMEAALADPSNDYIFQMDGGGGGDEPTGPVPGGALYDDFESGTIDLTNWSTSTRGDSSSVSVINDTETSSYVSELYALNDDPSNDRGEASMWMNTTNFEAFGANMRFSTFNGNAETDYARIRLQGSPFSTMTRNPSDSTGIVWCQTAIQANGYAFGYCNMATSSDFSTWEDIGSVDLGHVGDPFSWHYATLGFDGENVYFAVDGNTNILPIDTDTYPVVDSGWDDCSNGDCTGIKLRVEQASNTLEATALVDDVRTGTVSDLFYFNVGSTEIDDFADYGYYELRDEYVGDGRINYWLNFHKLTDPITRESYTYDQTDDVFGPGADSPYKNESYYYDGFSWVPFTLTDVTFDYDRQAATYSNPLNVELRLINSADIAGQSWHFHADGGEFTIPSLSSGARFYQYLMRGRTTGDFYEVYKQVTYDPEDVTDDAGPYLTIGAFLAANGGYPPVGGHKYDDCRILLIDNSSLSGSGLVIEYNSCSDAVENSNAGTWTQTTIGSYDAVVADVSADGYEASMQKGTALVAAIGPDNNVWQGQMISSGTFIWDFQHAYNDIVAGDIEGFLADPSNDSAFDDKSGGGGLPYWTIPQVGDGDITVDGDSPDWSGISRILTDPASDFAANDVDWTGVSLAYDSTNLYVRIERTGSGDVVSPENVSLWLYLHSFSPGDPAYSVNVGYIGGDTTYVYTLYDGSSDPYNAVELTSLTGSALGTDIEIAIPLSFIDQGYDYQLSFFGHHTESGVFNSGDTADYGDAQVSFSGGGGGGSAIALTLGVPQTDVGILSTDPGIGFSFEAPATGYAVIEVNSSTMLMGAMLQSCDDFGGGTCNIQGGGMMGVGIPLLMFQGGLTPSSTYYLGVGHGDTPQDGNFDVAVYDGGDETDNGNPKWVQTNIDLYPAFASAGTYYYKIRAEHSDVAIVVDPGGAASCTLTTYGSDSGFSSGQTGTDSSTDVFMLQETVTAGSDYYFKIDADGAVTPTVAVYNWTPPTGSYYLSGSPVTATNVQLNMDSGSPSRLQINLEDDTQSPRHMVQVTTTYEDKAVFDADIDSGGGTLVLDSEIFDAGMEYGGSYYSFTQNTFSVTVSMNPDGTYNFSSSGSMDDGTYTVDEIVGNNVPFDYPEGSMENPMALQSGVNLDNFTSTDTKYYMYNAPGPDIEIFVEVGSLGTIDVVYYGTDEKFSVPVGDSGGASASNVTLGESSIMPGLHYFSITPGTTGSIDITMGNSYP